MAHRIGCDVGGTFTDSCLVEPETGQATFVKVLTTPNDQTRGVVAATRRALEAAAVPGTAVAGFAHGTTTATNAILERKGARTALVVTRGFRDMVLIGTQMRPHLYDARARRPPSLVPRSLTFEVDERMDAAGTVLVPLNPSSLHALCEAVAAAAVASVAVVLLHSFANPSHERLVFRALHRCFPDLDISLSSEVLPEPGEYSRASTTIMNAYIMPTLRGYLRSLGAGLAGLGIARPPMIMQSNGGVMSVATAGGAKSVHTSLSGPAAGLIAARRFAIAGGHKDVVTVDMGGTSFDVGLVGTARSRCATKARSRAFPSASPCSTSLPLGLAVVASRRWMRAACLPSALEAPAPGPVPRPTTGAGHLPTVTDANVVLGRLRAGRTLGSITIDAERARAAIDDHVGKRWV